MKYFINFLNKFNNIFTQILNLFKALYPKLLIQKIKNFFSNIWESFLEKIQRFISEENYAQSQLEKLINGIFNATTISLFIALTTFGYIFYQLDQRAFFEGKFGLNELKKLVAIRKPAYTGFEEKEFYIPDLFVPVILKNRPDITRLYLDIKIRASNKYIKIYFCEDNFSKLDVLIDRYTTTLAPVIPMFPLTDEGKEILKDKIIRETNKLLKELKIEGEIEEVTIQDILAA